MEYNVVDLLHTFITQIYAAQKKDRYYEPGQIGAEQKCGRQNDQLVEKGAFSNSPEHREFTRGVKPCGLFRIDRKIIAKKSRGFLAANLLIAAASSRSRVISSSTAKSPPVIELQ